MTSGLNIIQGYAGYVSMCQVAFYGIGAYVSGLLMSKLGLSMPVGLLMAAAIGLVVGSGDRDSVPADEGALFFNRYTGIYNAGIYDHEGWHEVTGEYRDFLSLRSKVIFWTAAFLEGRVFLHCSDSGGADFAFVYRLFKSKTGRAIVTLRENEDLAKLWASMQRGTKLGV